MKGGGTVLLGIPNLGKNPIKGGGVIHEQTRSIHVMKGGDAILPSIPNLGKNPIKYFV